MSDGTPTGEALRLAAESIAMQAEDMERVRKAQAAHDAEIAARGSIRSRMRDSFAQEALNGLLAGHNPHDLTAAEFARNAYDIAEAMLAERERRNTP